MIIGDSHVRGCTAKIKDCLSDKFEVNGFVKPGAWSKSLTAKGEIVNLMKKDFLVFWGGTNDVSQNNSNIGLKYIVNFIKNNGYTNIVLLSASH